MREFMGGLKLDDYTKLALDQEAVTRSRAAQKTLADYLPGSVVSFENELWIVSGASELDGDLLLVPRYCRSYKEAKQRHVYVRIGAVRDGSAGVRFVN